MPACLHTIVIHAPIHRVWQVLTDFEHYPSWNPLIGKMRGQVKEHHWALAYFCPFRLNVPVKIIRLEAPKLMIWEVRFPHVSVVKARHYYKLEALNGQQTKLEHGEQFSGLLSKLFPPFLLSKVQAAYQYHNEKLKIIAENINNE